MKRFLSQGLVVWLGLVSAQAEESSRVLGVGDAAPPLKIAKFVQGEPVAELDREHVYVVEFWATWCGPCRQTIPHLNALQLKFAAQGLVVIGQNVFEPDDLAVAPFVKEMGEKMTYRVALDDKTVQNDGSMAQTWMKAAGKNGIPTAFVIGKEGKIAWIGHPGELQESLLQQVLDGSYDVAAAQAEVAAVDGKAKELSSRQLQLQEAMKAKDWTAAEKALTEFSKHLDPNRRKALRLTRLQILLGQQRTEEATQWAEKMASEAAENLTLMYQLANTLAAHPLPDLAEKYARQALEHADDQSRTSCQALLAKLLFQRDDQVGAIQTQTEALANAPESLKPRMQKTLESYQATK